jgi:hypothetical protein
MTSHNAAYSDHWDRDSHVTMCARPRGLLRGPKVTSLVARNSDRDMHTVITGAVVDWWLILPCPSICTLWLQGSDSLVADSAMPIDMHTVATGQ